MMKSFLFWFTLALALLVAAPVFGQSATIPTVDPSTGLQYCHQPGQLPAPFGPSVGVIVSATDAVATDINDHSLPATFSPGEIVRLTGLQFNFLDSQEAVLPVGKSLTTSLAGTKVLVNGTPQPIFWMAVNFTALPFPSVVEFESLGTTTTPATVQLEMTEPDGSGPCITPAYLDSAAVATPQGQIIVVRSSNYGTIFLPGHRRSRAGAFAQLLIDGSPARVLYADESEISYALPADYKAGGQHNFVAGHLGREAREFNFVLK